MRARLLALFFILPIVSAPSDAGEEARPQEAQCRALYLKRIGDLAEDAADPASIGIRENRQGLQSDATVKAAVAHCQSTMSARQVQCQLSPADCAEDPGKDNPTDPDQTGKQNDPGADPGKEPRENPKATAEECRSVYDHLLSIFATDEVKKKPGGEKLLENWRSPVARQSFQARCESVFHKEDAQCILSSKDPDIARACLLVIPE